MSKDKKDKKEPEPIDKVKERQGLVNAAYDEFLSGVLEFAGEHGLSSAEMFAIVSETIYKLASTVMQQEHEEYFGPDAEEIDE
jgi:hypothetical protein